MAVKPPNSRHIFGDALVGYAAVLAMTFTYFVPELMTIIQTAYTATVDADLTRRANLWETLSLVRLGCMVGMAVVLLRGLSKPGSKYEV